MIPDDIDLDTPAVIDGRDAVAFADADEHIRARNWHLARIAEAEAVAREVVARATAATNKVRARHQRHIDWHEAAVIGLHRALLLTDPKRKTINLPHGTMRARKARDHIEADPDVTIPWLDEHMPDLVRKSIDKAGVNRAVSAGVEIPGVAVTEGEVEFSISVELDRPEDGDE